MSTRLHIVVSDELLVLIDEARGDVPRSSWIRRSIEYRMARQWAGDDVKRRAVEQALGETSPCEGGSHQSPPAPAEQPRVEGRSLDDLGLVRASAVKPKRGSRSSGGCALHPAAGRTESRGAWWCAEPGCTRSVA